MQWLDAAADSIASAISGDGKAARASEEATPEEEEEARLQEAPASSSSWSWVGARLLPPASPLWLVSGPPLSHLFFFFASTSIRYY